MVLLHKTNEAQLALSRTNEGKTSQFTRHSEELFHAPHHCQISQGTFMWVNNVFVRKTAVQQAPSATERLRPVQVVWEYNHCAIQGKSNLGLFSNFPRIGHNFRNSHDQQEIQLALCSAEEMTLKVTYYNPFM